MARVQNTVERKRKRGRPGLNGAATARPARMGSVMAAAALAIGTFLHGIDAPSRSFVPTAHAQGSQGQLTSKQVTDAFFESQELFDAGDVAGAARVIQRVLGRDDLSPFEQGIMYRTLANYQLELEQYPQAITSLERAVGTGAFVEGELAELQFFLGGLYLSQERYDDAIRALETYFSLVESAGASAYYLLAQAYAVQERWRDALEPAQQAVQLTEDPNEGYLRLLVAVYINLGQWNQAVPLLEQIIAQFTGKDEYWQQLAAGYQELGREKDAYAVIELRYNLGFLTRSREFVVLADLHSFYGYPFKAAKLLQTEMDAGRVERTAENLEKIGNYWLAAREYREARQALIAASGESTDGELDFQIAGTFAQDENWQQAERYLQQALRRGGLSRSQQGSAWLLLGHSRNNLGKRRQALEAFKRASNYSNAERDASTWITFLEDQFRVEAQNQLVNAIQAVNDVASRTRTAVTDLEIIRDVAIQAKETAERAREATSDIARERALDEYRIRNQEGTNRLTDQREAAEEDARIGRGAIEDARAFDLSDNDRRDIDALEAIIIERLNLVTTAENNLREAADIVEELTGTRPATPNVPDEAQDLIPLPGTQADPAANGAAPAEGGDAAAAEDGASEEGGTGDDGSEEGGTQDGTEGDDAQGAGDEEAAPAEDAAPAGEGAEAPVEPDTEAADDETP